MADDGEGHVTTYFEIFQTFVTCQPLVHCAIHGHVGGRVADVIPYHDFLTTRRTEEVQRFGMDVNVFLLSLFDDAPQTAEKNRLEASFG